MKIFELRWTAQDEKEWIAADTNIEALKFYLSESSMDIDELDDIDEIVEVPKEDWSKISVRNGEYDEKDPDDWESKTFEEYMKDVHSPELIAGTMYE